jgi:hypothetical protein
MVMNQGHHGLTLLSLGREEVCKEVFYATRKGGKIFTKVKNTRHENGKWKVENG